MAQDPKASHTPLPATVRFVTIVGLIVAIGWLLMFRLTVLRW